MPWSTKYWLIIGVALTGLLSYFGAYEYGFLRGSAVVQPGTDDLSRAQAELQRLETENREHDERYEELWTELGRLRRELQINKATYTELSRALDESAATTTELREQLDFYDRILSATGESPGLRIHEFVVRRTGESGRYRYELLLIHMAGGESRLEGGIEIDLEGSQGAQTMLYSLADLGGPLKTVSLKYFQALRGNFELPGEFHPVRIQVRVRPRDGSNEGAEKWFPWNPL